GSFLSFFFQAEDGIRDGHVTGVQTCALPISLSRHEVSRHSRRRSIPARSKQNRWAPPVSPSKRVSLVYLQVCHDCAASLRTRKSSLSRAQRQCQKGFRRA